MRSRFLGPKHWPRWQFRALGWLVAGEARIRQSLSALRKDPDAVDHFRRLGQLARDLLRGRGVRARHRLLLSARSLNAIIPHRPR